VWLTRSRSTPQAGQAIFCLCATMVALRTPPSLRREYVLRDVFHAMKTEVVFDWTFWIDVTLQIMFKGCLRYCGALLIAVAICMILVIGLTCLAILLPVVSKPYSLYWWWNLVFGFFLLFNVLFNYCMAAHTSPGSPCSEESSPSSSSESQCKKCNVVKPPRAHHCSICGHCVLKMDHHCPWINRCVGLNNYRYFYLFLLYVTFATWYIAAVLSPHALGPNSVLGQSFAASQLNLAAQRFEARDAADDVKPKLPSSKHLRGKRVRNVDAANPTQIALGSDLAPILRDHGLLATLQTVLYFIRILAYAPPPPSTFLQDASVDPAGSKMGGQQRRRLLSHRMHSLLAMDHESIVFITFILCIGVGLGVGVLFGFHTYLILTSQTTLEAMMGAKLLIPSVASQESHHDQGSAPGCSSGILSKLIGRSRGPSSPRAFHSYPYSSGSNIKNWKQVFGEGTFLLGLMPSTRLPPPAVASDCQWVRSCTLQA